MRFISTFFYTIRQGIVNLFRNKWYSLASIATISSCLLMFGVFYSVVANFQYIVKMAQEGVSITVFFDEGLFYVSPNRNQEKIVLLIDCFD